MLVDLEFLGGRITSVLWQTDTKMTTSDSCLLGPVYNRFPLAVGTICDFASNQQNMEVCEMSFP